MTATTGIASSSINGCTAHSALGLPIKDSKATTSLTDEQLKSLRKKFEGIKLLIVDEISMLS